MSIFEDVVQSVLNTLAVNMLMKSKYFKIAIKILNAHLVGDIFEEKGDRERNGIHTVTQRRGKKAWIIHVYSHSANISFFSFLIDSARGAALLNTNSPRQL